MITKDTCINYILKKVPQFQSSWESHRNYWEGEEAGLCNDISSFTGFTVEKIKAKSQEVLGVIFPLVEELLKNGDEEVRTAIATCFLENLLNISSTGKIDSSSFVNLLGESSIEHCKKWDEFTGAKTKGL